MLQDEYYVVESSPDSFALDWDQPRERFGLGKPLQDLASIKVRLGEPTPNRLEWQDYHEMPAPVVSEKIANIFRSMNVYGVELIPADIRTSSSGDGYVRDFSVLHVWNQISCIDTENSEIEYSRSGDTIFGIDELVLSEDTLGLFDVRKRMIFQLMENTSTLLVHHSLKKAIDAVSPIGIRFFKVSEWNTDSVFD